MRAEYDVQARAHYYLDLWREWLQHDDSGLGYPSKVPLLLCQGAYWDSDSVLEALDAAAALATDAVIQGLQPYLKIAIRNAYERSRGIQSGLVLDEAHREVMRGLNKRGFY